jgi:maltose/moltooligosaccharide transporter
MKNKPRLSFWQIWNMSFGFLGIQFGFALQNANASRILQTFGADVHHLPWFWLVAPITGMIIQPIIGYFSDRTWTRLGRRRPYFLVGAILTSIALVLMPNAPHLTNIIAPMFIGGGMLMIMDASINISMEPFRALVADKLPDEQLTLGFSMQTLLIGIGAVVGSWLPYILGNWFGVATEGEHAGLVPPNVTYSFYFGAFVLFSAILWTIISTKEYPPDFYESEIKEVNSKIQNTQDHDTVACSTVFFMVCTLFNVGVHNACSGRKIFRNHGPKYTGFSGSRKLGWNSVWCL